MVMSQSSGLTIRDFVSTDIQNPKRNRIKGTLFLKEKYPAVQPPPLCCLGHFSRLLLLLLLPPLPATSNVHQQSTGPCSSICSIILASPALVHPFMHRIMLSMVWRLTFSRYSALQTPSSFLTPAIPVSWVGINLIVIPASPSFMANFKMSTLVFALLDLSLATMSPRNSTAQTAASSTTKASSANSSGSKFSRLRLEKPVGILFRPLAFWVCRNPRTRMVLNDTVSRIRGITWQMETPSRMSLLRTRGVMTQILDSMHHSIISEERECHWL
ncbi:hypothetical protein F5879DRAFT_945674 [Lentinula edodes]|nr:hypothetical protein F5879DRAFT_945674 [Lentinula edodes]